MTDQQQRPPLWRVMQAAACKYKCSGNWNLGHAAEILAVAERLEERFRLGPPETFVNLDSILTWFHDEALRAEAGE